MPVCTHSGCGEAGTALLLLLRANFLGWNFTAIVYLSLVGRQRTGLARLSRVKTQVQWVTVPASPSVSMTPLGTTSSSPSLLQLSLRKNPLNVSSWKSRTLLSTSFFLPELSSGFAASSTVICSSSSFLAALVSIAFSSGLFSSVLTDSFFFFVTAFFLP